MIAPIRQSSPRFVSLPAVCVIAAALYFAAAPVRGADAPAVDEVPGPSLPKGSIAIRVDSAEKKAKKPPITSTNPPLKYKGASLAGNEYNYATQPVDVESQVTYIIAVRNLSRVQAKNLEVEYHLYNLTRKTEFNNVLAPVLDDITAIQSVDVEPQKFANIIIPPLPKVD
ncbi:MAG: hypothetical protein ACRETL_10370, partial [Gammaproteobacteria bacterium]